MKALLIVPVILAMTACASSGGPPPVYKLKGYNGPEAMDSMEVIQQSKQCLFAKLRPNVNYLSVRTDQGKVLVPVAVNCEPL
jgi:hypothetical protein